MSSTHTVSVASNLSNEVRNIFAQVTRYPLDVLDLSSGLEEDLGIDSVKLGEVFAVLREQYNLPEKLDLPREQLRTIGGIAEALQVYLVRATPAPTPAPRPRPRRQRMAQTATAQQPSLMEMGIPTRHRCWKKCVRSLRK